MPYIVTKKQNYFPPAVVFRRAVATLDEAQWVAAEAIWLCNPVDQIALADSVSALTERGGTVGPLPDGTVIEVERVQEVDLRDSFDQDSLAAQAATLAEVVDAYNAAQ